jgi:hypothetical protein
LQGKKYGKKYEKKNKGKSTEKTYVEKKVRGKKYEKKSTKKKVWGKKVREKSRRKSTGKRYGQACAMVRSPSSEMKKISLNDIYFLTYLIDGKTFVWIYIFLNICLSTKYLK